MKVADIFYTAIKTTLIKMPALYRYRGTLPKSASNVQSWDQEDFSNREPIGSFVLATTTNAGLLGSTRTNSFDYRKIGLSSISVYRNKCPIAGKHLKTDIEKTI